LASARTESAETTKPNTLRERFGSIRGRAAAHPTTSPITR